MECNQDCWNCELEGCPYTFDDLDSEIDDTAREKGLSDSEKKERESRKRYWSSEKGKASKSAYNKKYYERNKERISQYKKEWYQKNRRQKDFTSWKWQYKKKYGKDPSVAEIKKWFDNFDRRMNDRLR